MPELIACCLLALAAVGVFALAAQGASVYRHLRTRPTSPTRSVPPISILKPLCGVDEDLEANIACFATLPYPGEYELLLGVRDERDPAWPVACRASFRWPRRVRAVLQQGAPGHNPKVNQLITLARAAHHDLLVVSDSNARVGPGYLNEIAGCFEDPSVGCVSNPVVGSGERSLGALLDNLHLASSVGAGQVSAKRLANRDLVVGKSMALRRGDLDALGGFEAFKDHLAEDYIIGRAVTDTLHKRVVIAREPVHNVSRDRSTGNFFQRYIRWSVIHRTAIARRTYLAQALLNPAPLAWIAAIVCPTWEAVLAALGITAAKTGLDVASASMLRGGGFGARALVAVPLKDVLLFLAWVNGLYTRTVSWRGNRLRVAEGSRLVSLESAPVASPVETLQREEEPAHAHAA
ncbi:MAG: glycosyltransferase [Myxococcaceae bacterium]